MEYESSQNVICQSRPHSRYEGGEIKPRRESFMGKRCLNEHCQGIIEDTKYATLEAPTKQNIL